MHFDYCTKKRRINFNFQSYLGYKGNFHTELVGKNNELIPYVKITH